jgi:hypothetical protein
MAALKPVLPIIRHHHERANGTGYPDGLHGEEIPFWRRYFPSPIFTMRFVCGGHIAPQ